MDFGLKRRACGSEYEWQVTAAVGVVARMYMRALYVDVAHVCGVMVGHIMLAAAPQRCVRRPKVQPSCQFASIHPATS